MVLRRFFHGDEKEVVQELLSIQAKELIVSEQMYVLINDLSAIHDFTVSIEKEELSDEGFKSTFRIIPIQRIKQ